MQLDEATHDGEPDTEPALAAVETAVALREHLENVRQELRLDTDAVVAHAHGHAAPIDEDVELDGTAVGRVLGRVVQNVAENLAQPREIAEHPDGSVGRVNGE